MEVNKLESSMYAYMNRYKNCFTSVVNGSKIEVFLYESKIKLEYKKIKLGYTYMNIYKNCLLLSKNLHIRTSDPLQHNSHIYLRYMGLITMYPK